MTDSSLKRFVEGAPLSDLDEADLRRESDRMVKTLEVHVRRAARMSQAIQEVAEACDAMSRTLMGDINTRGFGRGQLLGLVEGLNNVAATLGHVQSWSRRSTREPG